MNPSIIFTFVAVEEPSGGFSVHRLNGFPRAPKTFLCESKDEARAKARELAEEVAKTMGAKVVTEEVPAKHLDQFKKHLLGKVNMLSMPLVVKL